MKIKKEKISKIFIYSLIFLFVIVFLYMFITSKIEYDNTEDIQKEFENKTKYYCTPESRKAEVCIAVYEPVCGWFDQSVKCVRYPCAATYSNKCFACQDPKVEYFTEGECPK